MHRSSASDALGALALAGLAALLACAGPRAPAPPTSWSTVGCGPATRRGPGPAASPSSGDTVVAVGDSADIARAASGPRTRVLANGGAMVMPGFMDGHLHFIDGGFQLASVDLRPAELPEEFIARLKAFASERRPGEWILGGDWDHERWPGAPLPRREWIDSVTPNNPVFVYRLDGHMGLANTAALRAAGDRSRDQGHPRRRHRARPPDGEPTGILKDAAMGPVERAVPPLHRRPARRGAAAGAGLRGVEGCDRVRPRERGPGRPRHLSAGQDSGRAHRACRALLPARDLARGRRHHRPSSAAATTGCGSAA